MIEITLNKPFRLLSLVQTAYGVEELSSSEGPRFAAIGKEMTGRMYELGPSPIKREARVTWLAAQQTSESSA